jgi:ubiquinone/menaquinone biosynthesis C-methylase UbiE
MIQCREKSIGKWTSLRVPTSPEMQSAWTEYWKNGPVESLPQDKAAGRLGALDATWDEFFAEIPDGARLLDLATGGGDVVRRAVALEKHFKITGVDIADLSAVRATLKDPHVRLIGNVDISSLPLPDAAFDGVTSQFGIEYADLESAACEVMRVLAAGGRGRFVLHHAESAITRGCANSLAAHRFVFPDTSAFQCGRNVFELHRNAAPRAEIAEAESQFQSAVRQLELRLGNDPAFGTARNVVGFLDRLASAPRSHPAADGLAKLEMLEKYNEGCDLRKVAQLDAALDANGIRKLANTFAAAGAVVEPPNELKYLGGKLLGWSFSFRK